MFSQFFVLSLRGDTILHKDCKYIYLTYHTLATRILTQAPLCKILILNATDSIVIESNRILEYFIHLKHRSYAWMYDVWCSLENWIYVWLGNTSWFVIFIYAYLPFPPEHSTLYQISAKESQEKNLTRCIHTKWHSLRTLMTKLVLIFS